MLRIFVGFAIDNGVIKTEIFTCVHYSNGDFATICYEDLSFQTLIPSFNLGVFLMENNGRLPSLFISIKREMCREVDKDTIVLED